MNAIFTKLGNFFRNFLPLGNNPKTMIILTVFVLAMLAFIFLGKRAHGEEVDARPYVQFSTGHTVIRGGAPVLNLAWTWPSPQRPTDTFMTSLTLIGASNFNGQSVSNNYAFSVQYVTGFKNFDIGLGPSWMINPGPYNGANVNFNLMFGYRFQKWPVTLWYNHFSCGGACNPNLGRDMVLAGYRF